MLIGTKIKTIRKLRGMTQKDLGVALGFVEQNAAKRVSQYESNEKIPKDEVVSNITKILKVSPYALLKINEIKCIDLIEEAFWFEETINSRIANNQLMNTYVDFEIITNGTDPSNSSEYQSNNASITGLPENDLIFCAIRIKNYFLKMVRSGQMSNDSYLNWKICWPYNLDIMEYYKMYNNKSFSAEPDSHDSKFFKLITETDRLVKKEFNLIKLDYDIPLLPFAEMRIDDLTQFRNDNK